MPIDQNILLEAHKDPHPAMRVGFDELYGKLEAEIAEGNVFKQVIGDLAIYGYTIDCQFDNKWSIWSLIARGLILDVTAKNVVALTYPKFFNYGEGGYAAPNEGFTSFEKLDGSLGIVYHHKGDWNVATRGSLKSEQAQWAKKWLDENVDKQFLNPNVTYLTEIVYPSNRIVITYPFEGLILHGAYSLETGDEIPLDAFGLVTVNPFGRIAKKYHFKTVEEMVAVCKTLTHVDEGFVIKFDGGLRMKIKGDEYCRVHRLISNVTPMRMWESMMNGDNMDEVRKALPEELHTDFDNIIKILGEKLSGVVEEARKAYEETKHLSDKECGLLLKDSTSEIARNFVFPCRKLNFLEEVNKGGAGMRKKAFGWFKPRGNKLAGYAPSTAMNRFADALEQ